ncbi:MAG: hypothetical protein IT574_08670 [Candidatus Aureabacteria bacterium]|nr:hypothetical protein [Candidatus Auribacterota bacterium]HOE28262.1 OB-fold nucleic acid binding domain-containing protein [bacterium]
MQEQKQPNVCPDPQKALLDEVLCPGCGKFVGAYEKCPYCGTEMKKRMSIIFFKRAALVLAFGGLALLWFTATKMQPPLIRIGDVDEKDPNSARYNNAVVEVRGTVESVRTTGRDGISFEIDDGTGNIKAQAFRGREVMRQTGNTPHVGDQVAVVGSIQLTDKYGTSLMINIPEKVKVTPAKAEKVLLERITLDRKGALVEATGEIVIARRSGDDIFLTIGDATGLVEVPLFGRTIRYAKNKERFSTVGREITVIGTIGEYRGRPQITIRDVEEIVTLAEDTIPTDKIPGREEAVKKAAELESK